MLALIAAWEPQVTLYRAMMQMGPGMSEHHFLVISLVVARTLGLIVTCSNHLQAE